MKRVLVYLVIPLSILLLSGCATVKVYSDAELKNETGLRYYTLKPYLLVEYMAEKDNTVKTSVIYLPDLSSPQYMYLRPGIGSSELKMTFKAGVLETYGVVTDSKLPESMAAFADILSKSAYAAQTFTRSSSTEEESGILNFEPGIPFRLFEIVFSPGGSALKEVLP